jgi:Concanavalin A-like lectin/glucanases superfamily
MPFPVGYPASVAEARQLVRDFGTCLSFDGSNDIITIGTDNQFSGDFYFSAWLKWSGLTGSYQHIFAKRDSYGGTTMMFDLALVDSTGNLLLDGHASNVNFGYTLPKDRWFHLTWVHNVTDSVEQIYINGDRLSNSSIRTFGTGTTALNSIGAVHATPTEGFNGKMDKICIGTGAPTWGDVLAMYTKDSFTNAWATYELDEGSGTTALDSSGNGNDGTISGATYATDKVMTTRTAATTRNRVVSDVTITDTFTREDSDTSLGVSDTGQTWTRPPLGSAVFGIASNKAKYVSGSGIMILDAGTPDVDISVTMDTYAGANEMALYFRCTDGNNHFRLIRSGTSLLLQRRLSGSTVALASPGGLTFANGDVFRVWCHGPTILCFLNGVQRIKVYDTNLLTVTTHGFGTGTTNTGYRWDNFSLTSTNSGTRSAV